MKPFIQIAKTGHCLADINGIGSYSLYRAIYEKYYNADTNVVGYTNVQPLDNGTRNLIYRVDTPLWPTILLVRNPIERFKAACVYTKQTSKEAIDSILNLMQELEGESYLFEENSWFEPVVNYLTPGVDNLLFKYPLHINEAVSELELDVPFNLDLDGGYACVSVPLTQSQKNQLREIYAEDIDLYKSILTPGQKAII
jgi:hypothetical protein